jgi:hypothetical protein
MLSIHYCLNLWYLLDFGWKLYLQSSIWLIIYLLKPWILILHIFFCLESLLTIILFMFLVVFALFTYLPSNITSLLPRLFSVLFLSIAIPIKDLYVMMRIITRFAFHEIWFSVKINIFFRLVQILFLLLCCFLLLMTCLQLLIVLNQELFINDITHCLFLLLNQHLIMFYKSLDGQLGFYNLRIGMGSHILLFRPLLILFICLSLILRPLLECWR